jgi:hypothetical protein
MDPRGRLRRRPPAGGYDHHGLAVVELEDVVIDDVGVADGARGAGLAEEAADDVGAIHRGALEELERDVLAGDHVGRRPDGAHAALAEQVFQPVALRDHGARGELDRHGERS